MKKAIVLCLLLCSAMFVFAEEATEPEGEEEMTEHEAEEEPMEGEEEGEEEEGGDDDMSYKNAEHVDDVTPATIMKYVEDNEYVFMEFYAPWCGHCKALKPEWEKAGNLAAEQNLKVKFAAIQADGEDEENVLAQFDIKGFPTIKFFMGGKPKDYEGERTAEGIVNYAQKMAKDPAYDELKTQEDIDTFAKKDNAVIGFFPGEEKKEIFVEAVKELKMDFEIGQVIDAELCKANGFETAGVKVYHEEGDAETMKDTEMVDVSAVVKWVNAHGVPVFEELNPYNFEKRVATSELPSFILFVDPKKENDEKKGFLKTVAKENRGVIQGFFMDGVEFTGFVTHLGFTGKTLPVLTVLAPAERNHFLYDEEKDIDLAGIEQFVSDFKEKKLTRKLKSAPIPEKQAPGAHEIVGDNFQDIVFDEEKDVLVLFHAPWCHHCKAFMPKYNKVAKTMADIPDLLIGKVDMDANEIPSEIGIQGFPTIKFFLAGSKDAPVDYSGDRSVADLKKFIEEHATVDLESKPKEEKTEEKPKEEKPKEELKEEL